MRSSGICLLCAANIRVVFYFVLVALLSGTVLSGLARAGTGDDEVIDLSNDFVVPKPSPDGWPPMVHINGSSPYRLKVFINFDGATLKSGGNDSRQNLTSLVVTSPLAYPAMNFSAMGGRDKAIKDILDELKLLYNEYAVELVTTRPSSSEDYTMAMVGGTGQGCVQGGSGTVGIAPLDCKNTYKNDVVLIFGQKVSTSTKNLALVIAHELGHSFGLEHVTETTDIMYSALTSATCCWTSSSVQPPSSCGRTTQDAKKVLQDNLGVGPGDQVSPLVWFVRPGPGALLPPTFTFEVEAADDLKIHHVAVYVDGTKQVELSAAPFTSVVTSLSDGQHTLKAEVADYKPNITTDEITVTVDSRCVLDGTCKPGLGGIGQDCTTGTDCTSGICAVKDGAGHCAELCSSDTKLCPTATSCESVESPWASEKKEWACVKGTGYTLDRGPGSGGGCAVQGGPGTPPLRLNMVLVLLGVLGAAALRARSRRPRL